jgi:hypothetical protein
MAALSEWPRNASAYQIIRPIGYGAFGTVYSAIVLSGPHSNTKVAIK